MPIKIPDLYSAKVDSLTACGTIATTVEDLHKWAKDHDEQWYYYRRPTQGGDVMCRVSLDSNKDDGDIHFHIDVRASGWFTSGNLPSMTDDVPAFEDLVSPFLGQTTIVLVVIDFPITMSRAPSVIKVMATQAISHDSVTIRMTGGTLTVEGAPIDAIRWTVDPDDDKRVLISIEGKTHLAFSDSYLLECFALLMSYASTFFRLEDAHA